MWVGAVINGLQSRALLVIASGVFVAAQANQLVAMPQDNGGGLGNTNSAEVTAVEPSVANAAASGDANGNSDSTPPQPAGDPAAAPAGADAPANPDPNAVNRPAGQPVNPFLQFFANPINLLLISGILFMLIVVQPQRRQMKELQSQLAAIKKNDRVVTASGIHGIVVQVNANEGTVSLRIDESTGARMTINRESISKVIKTDTKE